MASPAARLWRMRALTFFVGRARRLASCVPTRGQAADVSITDPSAPADSITATDLIDRGTGGLAARAGRGVVLTLSSQWLKLVLQVVATVVIARMLSPHDYGVVGMVAALTGF